MESPNSSNVWTEVESAYGNIKDLDFVQPLCVLNGQRCTRFPIELYYLPCSCTICKACYMNFDQTEKCPKHKCKLHREELDNKTLTLEDLSVRRVRCKNAKRGCNFTGRLTDLEPHLTDSCCYMDTYCPLNCGEDVMKVNLQSHVSDYCINRVVNCSKCGMEVTQSAKSKHEQNCNYSQQNCELCSLPIASNEMERHILSCDHAIIPCKFSSLGCPFKDKRMNINRHEEINNHADIFIAAFNQTKQISDDLKELKGLLTKTPTDVMKEAYDSKLEDLRKEFQMSLEKMITEDLPINICESGSSTTSSDDLKSIKDEVIQKMNDFFDDLGKKIDDSLKELHDYVRYKSMEILERKIDAVLEKEESKAVDDLLLQHFGENLSSVLKSMQKVCLQRSGNMLMNMFQHKIQTMNAISSEDRNFNIPEESLDDFKQIYDGMMKKFETVTNIKISKIIIDILLYASEQLRQSIKRNTQEITASNENEVSNGVEYSSRSTFNQALQNIQTEITNQFVSAVKTMAANFERIIKVSFEETINKLKECSDCTFQAGNAGPECGENIAEDSVRKDLFTTGRN